MCKTIDMNVNI